MRKLLPVFLLSLSMAASAQPSEPFKELKTFIKQQPPVQTDSTSFLPFFRSQGLDYLFPYYKAFQQEELLIKNAGAFTYYTELAQTASFMGDQASVLALERWSYETLPDSTRSAIAQLSGMAKEVTYTDARKYILSHTANQKVVMINEAHDKPMHRAFTASLLEDLYKQGFRYLAMEMLDNSRSFAVTRLTYQTGYYTCEPVAGELVRKALSLGFTLTPYEDTVHTHSNNQREYAQAQHIYEVLQKDTAAKILVHAGYGHIEEGARSDTDIPMAAYFKIISGIDPLTIDQTEMCEGSNTGSGDLLYLSWIKENPTNVPVVAIQNEKAADPFGINLYDIHVIHPVAKYSNGRPVWMGMNGWKKETGIPPAYQLLFMVQAYYSDEYHEKNVGQIIPADQTYNVALNGYYYVYLHPGKYKIVFRDKLYKILGTKDIIVN